MAHARKVSFAIAGVQKSGTRALRYFLRAHPDIDFASTTEAHYFDIGIHNDPSDDYSGYHALIGPEADGKMIGDATPIYVFLRQVPERMRAYNPDLRLIVILRNPIERAYSQWVMQTERGQETTGFLRTILLEPLHYLRLGQNEFFSHVARGFYSTQLRRLYKVFPREQVLVLRNEDLAEAHDATMLRIYRFLGVRLVDPPPAERIPPDRADARAYPDMPSLARWLLRMVFARDIRRLAQMTGWDLSNWR